MYAQNEVLVTSGVGRITRQAIDAFTTLPRALRQDENNSRF